MPNFGQFGNATPDTEKARAVGGFSFSDVENDEQEHKKQSGLFDPIPAGRYHFTVYDCQSGYTKKDNYMMKTLLLDILHDDGHKTRITDWLTFKEGAGWKFRKFFSTIGLDDAFKQNDGIHGLDDPLWDTAIAQEGDFEIGNKTEAWNGETRRKNYVKFYCDPSKTEQ